MANITISPNMGLPIPVVGQEPGPDFAVDVNNSLNVVDGHDHSNGNGVKVTPDGLNITSDLTILGNSITNAAAISFNAISTDAILNSLYDKLGDLYFRDGRGNIIRITQSGSVTGASGTITGLPSGTASASYAAGTFTFQSATLTSANIDAGSYIFRNNTASSNGVTVSPPTSIPSDYSLTLPAIPAVNKFLGLDTSGNITGVSSSVISFSSSISGVTTSTTPTPIGTVTITASGTRPVEVSLMADPAGGTGTATFGFTGAAGTITVNAELSLVDDLSTVVGNYVVQSNSITTAVPASAVRFIIPAPPAGVRTYTLNLKISAPSVCVGRVDTAMMMAREL